MTYIIRFLPEVEEDVIAGYAWYEEKAPGLAKNSSECFMLVLVRFLGIHCFTQRCIENFGVVCLGDFHTPFTSE